jgi:hypothetical protein
MRGKEKKYPVPTSRSKTIDLVNTLSTSTTFYGSSVTSCYFYALGCGEHGGVVAGEVIGWSCAEGGIDCCVVDGYLC